jgi:GAF domain-containing protein
MLQRGVPFIGFGMVDNAIMIVAGDYIEMSIGVTLAIGTMTAAALGNIFADVIGLNLGGMIEEASHRMGLPEPTLSRAQKEMGVTRLVAYMGSSFGIAFGCLLGMLPLALISNEAREESPVEVFQALARRTARLVGAERAVIFELDTATRAVVVQQYQGGEEGEGEEGRESEGLGGLPLVLAQEVVEQVLESKVGLKMWSRRADAYYPSDGGKEERVTSSSAQQKEKRLIYRRQRSGGEAAVESLICWPVLDKEGQVMAIVVAVNATKQKDFDGQDETALAGLCAHVAEALINMTRRPEEHVSLTENLELLSLHCEVGWKEYRPSLKALLLGEEERRRVGGEEGRRVNVAIGSSVESEKGVRGTQPLNVSAA